MTVVVTLEDYRPSPRYDGEPWTQARIEEAPLASGPWTTLETIPLVPVDADPENPAYRNFTTDLGTAEDLWYRIVFLDADASTGLPTIPVQNVEDDRPVYAATSELFRILKIGNPSAAQETAAERVLAAASGEIDAEISLEDDDALSGWELALAGSGGAGARGGVVEAAGDPVRDRRAGVGVRGDAYGAEHVGQACVHVGAVEAAVGDRLGAGR